MLKYIQYLFAKKYPTGLLPDPRLESEKALDYLHEELVGASVPNYKDGTTNLNQYGGDEDQNYTSSCVAHGVSLADTKGDPRLSKMFIYRNRVNYPMEGMWLQDAGDILKKFGSCHYDLLPNVFNESFANALVIGSDQLHDAEKHKAQSYITVKTPNNIDTLAAIVSAGTPVAIIIYASYKEWAKQYPTTVDNTTPGTATVRHCICVVDSFIENGKKYLKIQDSAWFGGLGDRYLSEEFVQKRVYGAMYFKVFEPGVIPKPDHIFMVNLRLGDSSVEVRWLQERLQYEKVFPATQTPTGYFGGITLKAVKEYQAQHNIPNTGFFGPLTRTRMNLA